MVEQDSPFVACKPELVKCEPQLAANFAEPPKRTYQARMEAALAEQQGCDHAWNIAPICWKCGADYAALADDPHAGLYGPG